MFRFCRGNKMKILVCYSGQPRFYRKSYGFLSNTLRGARVDRICHFWSDHREEQDEILDIYRPIKCKFEEPRTFTDDVDLANNHNRAAQTTNDPSNFISMLYSRCEVGKLLAEVKEEYDWYIWTRTDICPVGSIAREIENKDSNNFYSSYVEGDEWNNTHMNTMLVCSNRQNIMHYLNNYNNYKKVFKSGIDYCDHRITMAHMKELDIKFESILGSGGVAGDPTHREWAIMRGTGLSYS